MPTTKAPSHGLFIRYGKFEAAAYGRLAVVCLLALICFGGWFAAKWMGLL